ncbi:MAG: uncharacterized protein QG656_2775 [Candidatus Hydrogenedentes bacterium]|nr:uncharacterized protein [Candidatus Hydrogenedentota bacterium]
MENKTVAGIVVAIVVVIAILPFVVKQMGGSSAPAVVTAQTSSDGSTPAAPAPVSGQAVGEQVASALLKGDYAGVTAKFDARMKTALTLEGLAATMQQVQAEAGAFKKQTGTRSEKIQGMDVVHVTCQFERANLEVQVAVDASGLVSGLYVKPAV